jgi:hypothetical protein
MFTDARISIVYRASVHLSARQLPAKQSYNRAFCRSSLHHDQDSAKSGGPKWVPTKNVGEASLAHNELPNTQIDQQCYACCTLPIRLTHRLTYPADRWPGS